MLETVRMQDQLRSESPIKGFEQLACSSCSDNSAPAPPAPLRAIALAARLAAGAVQQLLMPSALKMLGML